jgi:leucyl aminopeptidase (aminopeptidase T)
MQKRLTELATQAKIGMVSEPRLQQYADLIIEECINVLKTENSVKHCAYTTYQLSIVECTVEKAEKAIRNHFKEE